MTTAPKTYRGRLAPSPTGHLHLGHARTFWIAQQRARQNHGTLVLRNDDLDQGRARPEFVEAMFEDLHWFGFEWQEGPDVGGPLGPYTQSERTSLYQAAFRRLRRSGHLYPCSCSRKDVLNAVQAPHLGDEEPVYPGTCRPESGAPPIPSGPVPDSTVSWRFRVPDDTPVEFIDNRHGPCEYRAGRDFGDFVVWRRDNTPSYQLAVVVDDAAMKITEVVRGSDLLGSTARQILLYQALDLPVPAFHHCELLADPNGKRLAKRHDSLSLRALRQSGQSPDSLRQDWNQWLLSDLT